MRIALFTLLLIVCAAVFSQINFSKTKFPKPKEGTIVKMDMEEGNNGQLRRAHWENMHKAAPGVDWRTVERQNALHLYQELIATGNLNSRGEELLANGQLKGEWFERGSYDQAGSVQVIDYDKETDSLYAISAGGTLWRGAIDGYEWLPLNEGLRFDGRILQVLTSGTNSKRIFTAMAKDIFYSDDEGKTWSKSQGINYTNSWGAPKQMITLEDNAQTLWYVMQTWNDQLNKSSFEFFRSVNLGQTFEKMDSIFDAEYDQVGIFDPLDAAHALILVDGSRMVNLSSDDAITTAVTGLPTQVNVDLAGTKDASQLVAVMDNTKTFVSMDAGATWEEKSEIPIDPWGAGIVSSPNDLKYLIAGGVNMFRSQNGGTFYSLVNEWWEYYDDVLNKLHADMMDYEYFLKKDGSNFLVNCNHGGVYISYDDGLKFNNIGFYGLNVGQFYDVITSPADPNFIYGGTQDQGFQRTSLGTLQEPVSFDQVISGDYGQMAFSNNGKALWMEYPGGWYTYYDQPKTSGYTTEWQLEGDNKPNYGWMVPTAETADPAENSVYVGGGNINGGPGSYLIKLTAVNDAGTFSIESSQFDYDFRANSNTGENGISAIEISKIDPGFMYVATEDGTFFRSEDNGASWVRSAAFNGPDYLYLYGSTVLASTKTSKLLWFGGSGYSNPGVYRSVNGGKNFTPMNNGLPKTLVIELAASPDEKMLYAATEAGPYVYIVEENKWYPMLGASAPNQTYYSVEYVASQNVVRFGTHGRGIWDFKVDVTSSVKSDPVAEAIHVFPNPAINGQMVQFSGAKLVQGQFKIFTAEGKLVYQIPLQEGKPFKAPDLPGIYNFTISQNGKLGTGKLVVL
ncbi:MAG: T9SS type A sorting domain-containing protein [Saprospiraceae bacterium]